MGEKKSTEKHNLTKKKQKAVPKQAQTVPLEILAQRAVSPFELPDHPTARRLRQRNLFHLQRRYGNAYVQRVLEARKELQSGNPLTHPLIQRDEEPAEQIQMPAMIINLDPKWYARAKRKNKRYANNPPQPGWPYRADLKALWAQQKYDEFADEVQSFQVNVMGIDWDAKGADGILGSKSAVALDKYKAKSTGTANKKPEEQEGTQGVLEDVPQRPTSPSPETAAKINEILDPVRDIFSKYAPLEKKARKHYQKLYGTDKKIAAKRWKIEKDAYSIRKLDRKIEQLEESKAKSTAITKAKNKRKALLKKLEKNREKQDKRNQELQSQIQELKTKQGSIKRSKKDPKEALSIYRELKPERIALEKQLVTAIGQARQKIAGLDSPQLKAQAYAELNEYTPYHYQMENADILYDDDPAGGRTCNITVLAMVLQSLGKTNSDYKGGNFDMAKMGLIASFYRNELIDRGESEDFSALPLPDFLQLVAVDRQLKGDGTDLEAIRRARDAAADTITHLEVLENILTDFGSKRKTHYHSASLILSHFGQVTKAARNRSKVTKARDEAKQRATSEKFKDVAEVIKLIVPDLATMNDQISETMETSEIGKVIDNQINSIKPRIKDIPSENRSDINGRLNKINKAMRKVRKAKASKREESISDLKKKIEQATKRYETIVKAFEASGSHEEMKGLLSIEKYMAGLQPAFEALDAGKQIVLNLKGHYVRLQSFQDDGFIIDDPGRASGESMKVTWAEGIADGYFRKYIVVEP